MYIYVYLRCFLFWRIVDELQLVGEEEYRGSGYIGTQQQLIAARRAVIWIDLGGVQLARRLY